MASELFDPLLELALEVARKGQKASPPTAPPSRLAPMLGFAKLPNKAKDAAFDVLDTDESFRLRVLDAADERVVGRAGMAFLERHDGWQLLIDRLVEAAEEPLITPTAELRRLERRFATAERQRDRLQAELEASAVEREQSDATHRSLRAEHEALGDHLRHLEEENARLIDERQRAVTELKRTEEVMARHIAERKRLEQQLDDMTVAQLNTAVTGGGISDAQVRDGVDQLERTVGDLMSHLAQLRRLATPQRTPSRRRVALPIPPGRLDDSVEVGEYLLAVPGMTVLVDGYNVTREAHDEWDLIDQREWLHTSLCALAARTGANFDVVFDGADIDSSGTGMRDRGVLIRFSPADVEADDVVIESVDTLPLDRPVTVVSSDRRVRAGASERGANLLYSHQLLALL